MLLYFFAVLTSVVLQQARESSVSQPKVFFIIYLPFCAAARSICFSLGIADFGRDAGSALRYTSQRIRACESYVSVLFLCRHC
jgi:hypothetical protein